MIGYVRFNSSTSELNELTGEPCVNLNVTIQYNDGQMINTTLRIDEPYINFEDSFKIISKYFKGELVFR